MLNIKKLINLSSYLMRNSLIKESNYLVNLVKDAGYDWKEMGLTPHLKKDDTYKEEEISIKSPKKEEYIPYQDEEYDSWLDNNYYEIKNEPLNLDKAEKIFEEDNSNEDDKKIDDDLPRQMRDLREVLLNSTSNSTFERLIKLLNTDKYKHYAKYVFEEYPIQILLSVGSIRNFHKDFRMEIEIAKNSILEMRDVSKKSILKALRTHTLDDLILNLGQFDFVILSNKKILPFINEHFGENAERLAESTIQYYLK